MRVSIHSTKSYKLLFSILLQLYLPIKTDIPTHCQKAQVMGKWIFHYTEPERISSPDKHKCGHEQPSNPSTAQNVTYQKQRNFDFSKSIRLWLKEYKVELIDSSKDTFFSATNSSVDVDNIEESEKNIWTMVYDEGFDIKYANKRIFQFFRYESYDFGGFLNFGTDTASYAKTFCQNTQIGWYTELVNGVQMMGCVYGKMLEGDGPADQPRVNNGEVVEPDFFGTVSKENQDKGPLTTADVMLAQTHSRIVEGIHSF